MARRRGDNSFGRKKVIRENTDERLNAWRSLTPQQQLAALDDRLGRNIGARKQRARLQKILFA